MDKIQLLKLLFHQTDEDDYENSEFLDQGVQESAKNQEDDGKHGTHSICLLVTFTKSIFYGLFSIVL